MEEQDRALSYKKYVSEQPGFQVDIFNNIEFSGYPASTHVVQTLDLFDSTFPPLKQSPLSANIKGFLKINRSGVYSIELACDDGALLYIDGKRALNNWGFHTYEAKKGEIYLNEGWHYVLIRYQNHTGAAGLKLALGIAGEGRHSVGEGELFLAQNLPIGADPFVGILSEKVLRVNQFRALWMVLLILSILFFFYGQRIKLLAKSFEFWSAIILFGIAFGLRWVHYINHIYLRIQGIMDGGDNHYFVMLPVNFVISGDFVSFNCGNLGLLIPLAGLFYKYFHFFPGLHYFSLLMVFSGALLCLFPWMLLRKSSFSWVGLLAGLFLAINSLLTEFNIPYVSSDPLGLFIFGLGVTLGIKALADNKWRHYLLAGLVLGLLPITRTVYIPSAPIFALLLILFGQKRGRAFAGFVLFLVVMVGYEFLAQTIVKQPYYLYFIQDGFSATVVHRAGGQPQNMLEMLLWLPRFLWSYAVLMFDHLFPAKWDFLILKDCVVVLFGVSFILTALKRTRLFLYLFCVTGIYLFEISSYHLSERLTFPVVFSVGLIFALGLKELAQFLFKNRVGRWAFLMVPLLLFLSAGLLFIQLAETAQSLREKEKYYAWLKQELPEKGILLTDHLADPWELYQRVAHPVFFESTLDQTLVVNRNVVPVHRVTFLEDQSQIPKFKKHTPEAQFFRHHPYVMAGLAEQGYRYFIFQPDFAHKIEKYYFNNRKAMSINEKNYELKKIKDYPSNPEQGLWEVVWKGEPVEQVATWQPPTYPEDLDRFLKESF